MKNLQIYSDRLKKLRSKLKDIDLFVIENPIDLYYLTGLRLSCGFLFLSPKSETLFVDGRYFEVCKKYAPMPVIELKEEALRTFLAKKGGKTLGFDKKGMSYLQFLNLKKLKQKLIPYDSPLLEVRGIKEKDEISKIKKSAKLLCRGMDYLKKQLSVGITEQELALRFEIFVRQNGAEKLAFDPIIAFGKSSAYPHYHTGKTKLTLNQAVLIDIGIIVDGYCSDMTRTHMFGKPSKKLMEIERIVKNAHKKAVNLCIPNTPIKELDKVARDYIKKEGYDTFFPHNLGHGVGLEVHEYPSIAPKKKASPTVLSPGMVITIEPGIYLPGIGGVRHEDMILITEKRPINITL